MLLSKGFGGALDIQQQETLMDIVSIHNGHMSYILNSLKGIINGII